MKTFICFSFILFLSNYAKSQPVTINNEPAKVSYYRMPDEPLDPTYRTYSADLNIPFSELGKTGMTETYVEDTYLKLEGYKKVTTKGDVEITGDVGNFTIWMESRSNTKTKTKDKQGNEQVKIKYHMEVKYSLPMTLQVYNKKGDRLLDSYVLSNANTQNWISPSYNSLSDLESYWRVNRSSRLAQLQKDLFQKGLNTIYDEINNRFGYRRINDTVKFETIGKKKHELYEVFLKNANIIVEAFRLMDADKGVEEIKTKIKPALAFYAEQSENYKSSSKDDERLRHITLYNQALAYYWTEQFTEAKKLAEQILQKSSKDRDAKRLIEDIDETQTSLARVGRTTRHKVVVGSKA